MTNPEPFMKKGIFDAATVAALHLGADTEFIPRSEIVAEALRLYPEFHYEQINNALSNGERIAKKLFTARRKKGKRFAFKLTDRGHQMASDASLNESKALHPSNQDEFFEALETALAEVPEPVRFEETITLDDGRSVVEDTQGNIYIAAFQYIGKRGIMQDPVDQAIDELVEEGLIEVV